MTGLRHSWALAALLALPLTLSACSPKTEDQPAAPPAPVKVTGYVERIAAPKGFDGIAKGATFVGAGKTVIIAVTGEATGGGESPPNPATLTYQRADGASRVFVGTWTCGP